MDGRAFLDVARERVLGVTEAHWRAAAGRAYYALMLECRETLRQWGFTAPPRDQVHAFVRLRLTYAVDPDLKHVGIALDYLIQLRNRADYEMISSSFSTDARAQRAVLDAEQALALLDKVARDPARRAAAIASIQASWP